MIHRPQYDSDSDSDSDSGHTPDAPPARPGPALVDQLCGHMRDTMTVAAFERQVVRKISRGAHETFADFVEEHMAEHDPDQTPLIQSTNTVGTVWLGRELELQKMVCAIGTGGYNRQWFASLHASIKCTPLVRLPWETSASAPAGGELPRNRCTHLTFASGNDIMTGTQTTEDAQLGAVLLVNWLRRNGYDVTYNNYHTKNNVSVAYVHAPVDLRAMAVVYQDCAEYEPRIFPGLIYRVLGTGPGTENRRGRQKKRVFLVFASGGIVCTGFEHHEDAQRDFDQFYQTRLRPFVITDTYRREAAMASVEDDNALEAATGENLTLDRLNTMIGRIVD